MERLRAKLKSESGASITFALLLFLVCSVLAIIILVAATTAAGRMKNLAVTDQKYYAVTSAAELLKDELLKDESGNPLTVSKVIVVQVDQSGTESEQTYYLKKKADEIRIGDISSAVTEDNAAKFPWRIVNASKTGQTLNLSVSGTGIDFGNSMNVTIEEKFGNDDNSIEYTITDQIDTNYSVKMVFAITGRSVSYNDYPEDSIMEEGTYIQSVVERTLNLKEIKIQ